LSQISVLSEVVLQKVSNVPAVEETLTKMGNLSRDLLDSLNEIVWAINPNRDSLHDLTQRMRRLTNDFVSARPLECSFHAPTPPGHLKIGALSQIASEEGRGHPFVVGSYAAMRKIV
jgi:hypothetical protein